MADDRPKDPLSFLTEAARVPATQAERLLRVGGMAGRVVAGAVGATAKRWLKGDSTSWSDALVAGLDPEHVSRSLARMRGAAMKLGQLVSMELGDALPGPLADALATLRAQGTTMSERQLHRVLTDEYGPRWRERFASFDPRPFAAASIGQVHRAETPDGRDLALKVQFPGVATSIGSDVDNLATLLRLSSLLPGDVALEPLLAEVKTQLASETDYLAEATNLTRYAALVGEMPGIVVPAAHDDLTTGRVLAMDFVDAEPIETLWRADAKQSIRDGVGLRLQTLVFRELFEFGLMQSDPNFANFLYAPDSDELVLLDFGATIEVSDTVRAKYRRIVTAASDDDLDLVADLFVEFGWAPPTLSREQLAGLARFVHLSVEPLRSDGPYDYGASTLVERARELLVDLAFNHGVRHPPPPELVFIHRKLSGTYLLCAELGAVIDSRAMFRDLLRPRSGS